MKNLCLHPNTYSYILYKFGKKSTKKIFTAVLKVKITLFFLSFCCSVENPFEENAPVHLNVSENAPSTSRTNSEQDSVLVEDITSSASTSANISIDAQREHAHSEIPVRSLTDEIEEEDGGERQLNTTEEVCIFCKKAQRMYNRKYIKLSVTKCEKTIVELKNTATEMNDVELLQEIQVIMATRGSLLYHHNCKIDYGNKLRSKIRAGKERTEFHHRRTLHATALDYVSGHVEEYVIQEGKPILMETLQFIYKTRLKDEIDRQQLNIDVNHTNRNLEQNLLSAFKGKIEFGCKDNITYVKPYHSTVEIDLTELEEEAKIQQVGIIIRHCIDMIEAKKFGDEITVQDLIKGECEIPLKLDQLIRSIATNPLSRRDVSTKKQRQIKSVASDIIYITTNGKLKTSKHVTYGLALKSLSNSKKIITITNEYGHCCSYTTLQELETEATFSLSSSSEICPKNIIRQPNLGTGVAFDNFDRYVIETQCIETFLPTIVELINVFLL